jgi:hypothetical protein
VAGKLVSIVAIIVFFLLVFLAVNTLHFRFLPVHVVLYDTLLDAALAAVIIGGVVFALHRRLPLTKHESALTLLVGFLLSAIYAITFPTIIDRSLSIYILEKLAQRGGSIRQSAVEEILVKEFFPEHRLVEARLTEQINSGTIVVSNGCVRLTPLGYSIARFTRFYRTTMLPRRREILGTYTDDLTDPFRKPASAVSYKCDEPR